MKISWRNAIVFLICCCYLLACSPGNEITNTSKYRGTLERGRKDHRSFVMYSGIDTFAVTSIAVERRSREFTVQLDKPDSLQRPVNSKLPPSNKKIFIYMKDSTSYTLDEPHTIPLKNISRLLVTE
jgi:hypothetical protein